MKNRLEESRLPDAASNAGHVIKASHSRVVMNTSKVHVAQRPNRSLEWTSTSWLRSQNFNVRFPCNLKAASLSPDGHPNCSTYGHPNCSRQDGQIMGG
jgi:hypothetical protein